MLSSVQVETMFLISLLVHVKTSRQTGLGFFFPLHNVYVHSYCGSLSCYSISLHIVGAKRWSVQDNFFVTKMILRSISLTDLLRLWKASCYLYSQEHLIVCQHSVLEVSQICSGLPVGICIWLCDLVTWLLDLARNLFVWVLNCNVI